jgi:hypothetical protein
VSRPPRGGSVLLGAAIVMAASLAGCSSPPAAPPAPIVVPEEALTGLLLSVNEIRSLMGGARLFPQDVASGMDDNRNLLPNVNCLGVWHPDESAVYGPSKTDTDSDGGWLAVRRQLLAPPGGDQWRSSVIQSVVSYGSAQDAKGFFDASADRWGKCVQHNVNITLNDQRLPRWRSGDLAATPDRLTMPISRSDGTTPASCQHVLSLAANLIIDVQACSPQTAPMTQAGEITTRIAHNIPHAE